MFSNFSDTLNFISKLNSRRIFNYLKLYSSYHISKATGKLNHSGNPFSISIEPTTNCNLRCPECPSGLRAFSRATGNLSFQMFKKIIDEIHNELTYLNLYFQGEPFLNKSFFDFISYASSKKIYTSTSTNGHYLSDENCKQLLKSNLDRLIVSIDGTTQETYSKYRIGGKLDKVISGIENLVLHKEKFRKKTPFIFIQFIVNRFNEHQVEEIKTLSKNLKANGLGLKTMQLYNEEKTEWIPAKKFSRYSIQNEKLKIDNSLLNHCWRMWQGCVVTWDGKVVPCCFDKDAKHHLGNLSENNFSSVWKSNSYDNFRSSILKSRAEIDICKNCSEGSKIWN